MGQKEKLIARLRTRPRDFTLEEMEDGSVHSELYARFIDGV